MQSRLLLCQSLDRGLPNRGTERHQRGDLRYLEKPGALSEGNWLERRSRQFGREGQSRCLIGTLVN
jgi:hypothetical protein